MGTLKVGVRKSSGREGGLVSKSAYGNATAATRETPGSWGSSGDEREERTQDVMGRTSPMAAMPVGSVEMVGLKKFGTWW